ncbi:hypothetical protein LRS73_16850 [Methylobacterium currus]|uniref:hypothetical protein n=1 Tax=Methylobacterium currus TaxID=2051553 RepID=UPI000F50BC2F|nr:hypothetical protein [Methylobacterium currus]UHC14237.1 hypothetical protein LRS73_16850 [Methylobacterium currus]
MNRSTRFVAMLSGTVMASPVSAETITQHLSVQQGKSLMVDAIYALKDDCSPGPFPEIRVKQMPANGQLKAGAARFPIATDKHCPNVVAKSLAVSYFPYPNFTGEETIAANVLMPNGKENVYKWIIKVTPQLESSIQASQVSARPRSTP